MLTALVGILFLVNMAQSGRSSYEEILIKAKNNELSTPDDPSEKSAGEYSFIHKCLKWVPECCFPKFLSDIYLDYFCHVMNTLNY